MVSSKKRLSQETTATLRQAFREVTLGLMGVFQLHDVEPRLVADAAEMLARVYRAHAGAAKRRESPNTAIHEFERDGDNAAEKVA